MSLSDLIARLEDAVRLAGAREEMLNRPSAAVLRYEDAKRLLRLLRAGEKAVGAIKAHSALPEYPTHCVTCAAALREWDEAARG